MSLYAEYVKEKRGLETIESEQGFLTYELAGENCYIADIYVRIGDRRSGAAVRMINELGRIAIESGCKRVFGSVDPTNRNADDGLKLILAMGMKLVSVEGKLIYFVMELDQWQPRES